MATFRFLSLYVRLPFLLLAVVEFFIAMASVSLGVLVRFQGDIVAASQATGLPWASAFAFACVVSLSLTALGLYQSRFRGSATAMILRLGFAVSLGWLGAVLVFYFFPDIWLGRGAMALASLFCFFSYATIRPLFYRLVDVESNKPSLLVLGAGRQAALLQARLRRRADRRGFTLLGYVPLDSDFPEASLLAPYLQRQPGESLLALCQRCGADELLVALDDRRASLPVDELVDCRFAGISVVDLPSFFEREVNFVPLESVGASWLAFTNGFDFPLVQRGVKRVLDMSMALVLLSVSWWVMLLTILAVKFEEGWAAPVLYRQQRVGRFGQPFWLYKFRSMRTDAEAAGPVWARDSDDRITRVGRFIRNKRIDELPQLWNVLRGDMSFVGPRPERPEFVQQLSNVVPYYLLRHQVKPGITGWAQLSYPYGSSTEDARRKHEYDLYYVKHRDLFLDLLIIVLTVEVVLFSKGAR